MTTSTFFSAPYLLSYRGMLSEQHLVFLYILVRRRQQTTQCTTKSTFKTGEIFRTQTHLQFQLDSGINFQKIYLSRKFVKKGKRGLVFKAKIKREVRHNKSHTVKNLLINSSWIKISNWNSKSNF